MSTLEQTMKDWLESGCDSEAGAKEDYGVCLVRRVNEARTIILSALSIMEQNQPKPCPYCTSDNRAVKDTYFDQNCSQCVARMFEGTN